MLDRDRDICSSVISSQNASDSDAISMQRFRQFLPEVWREVCRHLEISESADRIRQMLDDHLPLSRLVIFRIDQQANRAVIAADVPHSPRSASHGAAWAEQLSERQRRRLLQWIRSGGTMRSGESDEVSFPMPAGMEADADFLAAALRGLHDTLGMMLLVPRRGVRLSEQHQVMVAALQEPLAVAMENDRRLHELNQLRERAEADRSSLLLKLGRSAVNDAIIGAESGLKLVMQRVRQIEAAEVPVLILGATGTGKELVARAIHRGSPRAHGPFIRVNCGAIPAELIDSQLFGHEKGSFTGAVDTRPGWFERADGGTLFLDEIGELPLDAQVRFLRVLQDGYVERVGSHSPIHVNVRVVAATHRDLASMVSKGQFREDLWYRIAVFPILIPHLRERRDDIPALVQHFASRAAHRFGLPPVTPTPEDIALLQNYDWPGNIRELTAVIDRARDPGRRAIAGNCGHLLGSASPALATQGAARGVLHDLDATGLDQGHTQRRHPQPY